MGRDSSPAWVKRRFVCKRWLGCISMPKPKDTIAIACACGATHQFDARYAGRIARCPKLNKRFRIPKSSGQVEFFTDPSASTKKSSRDKGQGESGSGVASPVAMQDLPLLEHFPILCAGVSISGEETAAVVWGHGA